MVIRRVLMRVGIGLVLVVLLVYPLDWAVWRVRVAMGGGMGEVTVSRVVVSALKGGKEMYYPDGSAVVDCSRSFLPEAGGGACWWLERHREVVERY